MTCAKRRVTCRIEVTHPSGEFEYVVGENSCANPQTTCPREPGEDYTKCRTICQQGGHAEIRAIELAKKAGMNTGSGIALITGHYWICEPCGRALRDAGLRLVVIEL
jgi:deoxycytidylate deaminase